MLEAPQRAGAAESGLHLVAHQQCLVPGAPLAQRTHVLGRREGRTATLVRFQDYSGYVIRLDSELTQRASEAFKRSIRRPKTVGEGYLHEAWIEIADPFLERRDAANLL